MLASLFERCMKRRGVKDCDPYDWEKTDTVTSNTGQSNLSGHMHLKNEQLHGNVTQMTVVGSNGSGMDYVSKEKT